MPVSGPVKVNKPRSARQRLFNLQHIDEGAPWLIVAGIILIPLAVAVVGWWTDQRIDERQRQLSEELYQRQERLTAAQMIDAYFQGVGEVLLSEMESATRDRIVAARTTALLRRLTRADDRAMVLRFVSQTHPSLTRRPARSLERSTVPFIDLSGIDLSGSDLSFANLYGADLSNANLVGTNLSWSNLVEANLTGASLDDANLSGAEIRGAILVGSSLRGVRLRGANLSSARLSGSNLHGADLSNLRFEGISTPTNFSDAVLDDAIWVDGRRCGAPSVGVCR